MRKRRRGRQGKEQGSGCYFNEYGSGDGIVVIMVVMMVMIVIKMQ